MSLELNTSGMLKKKKKKKGVDLSTVVLAYNLGSQETGAGSQPGLHRKPYLKKQTNKKKPSNNKEQ